MVTFENMICVSILLIAIYYVLCSLYKNRTCLFWEDVKLFVLNLGKFVKK